MGAGGSSSWGETHIVKLVFPPYYSDPSSDPITVAEHKLAQESWQDILFDRSTEFLERKKNDKDFPYESNIIFFYDEFYNRLFDVHPGSKSLFKTGMKCQGNALVSMISVAVAELGNAQNVDPALVKLAEVHHKRGVKSVEYGVVGEVLLWALEKVMGASYDAQMNLAWVKVYSRLLMIIIPTAVALELKEHQSNEASSNQNKYAIPAIDPADEKTKEIN
ncbi:globin-like protein [Ochromonadaceae sp. CCMP2298]|nr:globin-like protein [Ochromonadaceae sp. CCMP2298]|mmetsp:Transcript_19547/g.42418  ORF Transcript_19547/g.42418 Transcript_19547/m.42418 type:complete len:220 (+) Transcript_19547:117-776(+)